MPENGLFDFAEHEIQKVANLSGISGSSRRARKEITVWLEGSRIAYDPRKEHYTTDRKNYLSSDPGIQGVEDAFTSDDRSWKDLPVERLLTRGVDYQIDADAYESSRKEIAVVGKAASGDSESLEELLNRGGSPNAKLPNDLSALHAAVEYGEEETAQVLVRSGADANYTPSSDRYSTGSQTPLKTAIEAENFDAAETLMEKDIDRPGIPIERGFRPVHFAASNGRVSLFKKLVDQGTPLQDLKDGVSTIAFALLAHREGDLNSDRKLCTFLDIATKEGDSLSGAMLRDEGWMVDYAIEKCSGMTKERLTKDDDVGDGCL